MVTREHLYLLKARCYQASQQLSGMTFPDADTNQIRDELIAYANVIYNLNIERTVEKDRNLHARLIIVVTELISCLVESYVNPIDPELPFVVRKLASEWGIDIRTNVILFSHGPYSVRHFAPWVFGLLESLYGIRFSKKPRVVYLPREYDGDVLFSSVVFHEVGHMVERERSLGGKVYDELLKSVRSSSSAIFKDYFRPEFNQASINEKRVRDYIKEYISDLFGGQYLREHILHYLECYESLRRDEDSPDHPCFECRARLVNSFLSYSSKNPPQTSDRFLNIIIDVFHNEAAIPDLQLRDRDLPEDDFLAGNSKRLANDQELFSLFSAAWRASLRGIGAAESARNMTAGSLSRNDYYSSINGAAKQSISDYMAANP